MSSRRPCPAATPASLLKLVVDGSTDRVLGCHVVGDAAAETIRAVAIAVQIKRPTPISTRRLRCIRRQRKNW
jgi:pyruvate/2-oxoglutarate dehydrogenase complex dihydrolipoamide dehydrogenase (E3) component